MHRFPGEMMGCRLGLYWDETLYYYITNLQGDVIAVLDSSGVYAAWYVYDTRGKVLKPPSGSNQHPQQ